MLNKILAGLLDLSEQYNECALKVKLENLIRTELTTDNVAKFFSIADKFKAKVCNVCFVYYDRQIVCSVIILWLVRQNFVSNKTFGCYFSPYHTSSSIIYTYQNLVEYCVKYIAGHMKLVLKSQGFRQLDPFVLQKLMTSLAPYDVFKT